MLFADRIIEKSEKLVKVAQIEYIPYATTFFKIFKRFFRQKSG